MRRFRRWRLAERGVSVGALMILSMPLLLGVFGFGFDALRIAYAKRYAQGRLDIAAQSAAAVTYVQSDGSLRLGNGPFEEDAWRTTAYSVYAENTARARAGTNGARSLFQCGIGEVTSGARPTWGDDGQKCAGVAEVIGVPPTPDYDFCTDPGWRGSDVSARDSYGVRFSVKESVPMVFLGFLGIQSVPIEIQSEALLRQQNC